MITNDIFCANLLTAMDLENSKNLTGQISFSGFPAAQNDLNQVLSQGKVEVTRKFTTVNRFFTFRLLRPYRSVAD
jgi:hypothetical protein